MTLVLRGGRVFDGSDFQPLDVAIEGRRITHVAPALRLAGAATWDLAGDLLLPGFINAHYHSPDNLVTGRLPNVPLELWSLASVPSRGSQPDTLRTAARLGAAQLLLGGVTSVVDMVRPSGPLTVEAFDAVAEAYLVAGLRAAVVPVLRDLPVEDTLPLGWRSPPQPEVPVHEQLEVVRRLFTSWNARANRLQVHVGPSAPHRCSDDLLQAALRLADELGTLVHTHVLETRTQAAQARQRWGTTMLRHLDRLGALSPRSVLAHVVWPELDELDLLAARGAVVVHNPTSNCALGSGRAPLPGMLAAGVRTALGTDAATCNDGLSLFEAIKLATILHRPDEPAWERWPRVDQTLSMATQGGAAALGLADELGRVEPGYLADLIVLDARAPALTPPNNLPRQLVMRGGPDLVRHVIVDGQTVVRDRRLLTLDWPAVAAAANHLAAEAQPAATPDPALVAAVEHVVREGRSA